jgi:hypothetical protein
MALQRLLCAFLPLATSAINTLACYKVHSDPLVLTQYYCSMISTYITARVSVLQRKAMTERVITHVTAKWCDSTICVAVSSDEPANIMTYCTHHSKMAAPRHVCADVSSDYSDH